MSVPNYTLQSEFDKEEQARLVRERECPHAHWITRCSDCKKIMASDHHINVHTEKSHKQNNKVAIYIFNKEPVITNAILERIRYLRQHYDQVIMLVDTYDQWQVAAELKSIWRVSYEPLKLEVKNQVKYRGHSLTKLDIVLYPDTNSPEIEEELAQNKTFYKKHVNIINHE